MNKPIPPARPTKPYAPDKDQVEVKHYLDVESLFFKKTYHTYEDEDNDVPVEITKEQFEYGKGYIDTEHLSPTLTQIVKLVPPGIPMDQIHLEIKTYPSDAFETFEGVSMYYTTPFNYETALKEYKKLLAQFEVDKEHYKKVLGPAYNKAMKAYQKEKAQKALIKQEANLKNQLKELEKKKKVK